ncbi:MAG: NYN domain-containing protein [Paracoccaceae bacterium]
MTHLPGPEFTRVALLIDGDNLSARHAEKLAETAAGIGTVTVRRVYGQEAAMRAWSAVASVAPRLTGSGKNGADMLLCIEAMELVIDGRADCFVIASSDRDFGHLAERLVGRGFHVVGAGEGKAPPDFRAKCSRFVALAGDAGPARPLPEAPLPEGPEDVVARLVREGAGMDGWMCLSALNLRYVATGRDRKATVGANWAKWIGKRPSLFHLHPTRNKLRLA